MATTVLEIPTSSRVGAGRVPSAWGIKPEWLDGQIWRITPADARLDGNLDGLKDPLTGLTSAIVNTLARENIAREDVIVTQRRSENAVYVQNLTVVPEAPAPAPATEYPTATASA